ncbi:MAG: hypothetical protein AAGE84_29100 [Cyanobacteria bacterium P01_G01_bin.39]
MTISPIQDFLKSFQLQWRSLGIVEKLNRLEQNYYSRTKLCQDMMMLKLR